jgi:iron complex outermembrane receptor protein
MKISLGARIVASALAGASFLAAFSPQALARAEDLQTKHKFEIPAQSLDTALLAFSDQAKVQVLMWAESKSDAKSAGAIGELRSLDALNAILANTGLGYKQIDKETVAIVKPDGTTKPVSQNGQFDGAATALKIAQSDSGQQPQSSAENTQNSKDQSTASVPSAKGKDHESKLEEIVVTGSNIRGIENNTSPLQIYDREAIDSSGYATTDDFIRALPQNFKGGPTGAGPDGALTGAAFSNPENASGVNLRGLGSSATLTLINGHRVAPSASGSVVDISLIPLEAIERIEVQTDGASAVYGSDAVGGVVNVILRHNFQGAQTTLREDVPTQGGGATTLVGQTIGGASDRGSVLLTADYQNQTRITSMDRTFTESLAQPSDVYPATKKYSAVFAGTLNIVQDLSAFSDVLYNHERTMRLFTSPGRRPSTTGLDNTIDFGSASSGLRWKAFADWQLEVSALYSREETQVKYNFVSPPIKGYAPGAPYSESIATIKEGDLKLDGTLFEIPGGRVKAAIGGSYRRDDFTYEKQASIGGFDEGRHDSAEYAEIYVPIVSSLNSIAFVRRFDISAAVRHDSYSDFGATTNPKVGLSWAPFEAVSLRAAYSTSFRVPNDQEVFDVAGTTQAYIYPGFANPAGGGTTNVLLTPGGSLTPEKARNVTAGFEVKPPIVPGLHFSASYYNIKYANRIIESPFSYAVLTQPSVYGPLIGRYQSDTEAAAALAALTSRGLTLFDLTGKGAAGLRYSFPFGAINAAEVRTNGFDFDAGYTTDVGASHITSDIAATLIKNIQTGFCAECSSTDLSNAYGQPPHLRLRATGGWSEGRIAVNAAVNYVNSYRDINVVPTGTINAYATVDFVARYFLPWFERTKLALNVTNLFDRNPPWTAATVYGIHYDPSNADPVGRTVGLQLTHTW